MVTFWKVQNVTLSTGVTAMDQESGGWGGFFGGFASYQLSLQRKAASPFCITGFPVWEMKIMVACVVHSLMSFLEIYRDSYKVY